MTQTAKNTPGPWMVNGHNQVWEAINPQHRAGRIALLHSGDPCTRQLPKEEQEANAHLIAASPAMYDALEEIVSEPKSTFQVTIEQSRDFWFERAQRIEAIAMKALAVARGEKS